MTTEERLIEIEMALANQEKTLDELNKVVFEQGQKIDHLLKLNKYLLDLVDKDVVKPLSEETPPPHY
ncbi:MAG: SlyX family protein [Alphaproteobacteria bacterium]|nr:SlyX family protein [Alphaproteobacteria bacterium]